MNKRLNINKKTKLLLIRSVLLGVLGGGCGPSSIDSRSALSTFTKTSPHTADKCDDKALREKNICLYDPSLQQGFVSQHKNKKKKKNLTFIQSFQEYCKNLDEAIDTQDNRKYFESFNNLVRFLIDNQDTNKYILQSSQKYQEILGRILDYYQEIWQKKTDLLFF